MTKTQIDYLRRRIRSHKSKIEEKSFFTCDEEGEPDEIKSARKLIHDWEDQREADIKATNDAIDRHVKKLEQSIHFDTPESAIADIEDFENMTTEDFRQP